MQKARWFDDVHASRTSPATANLGSPLGLSERSYYSYSFATAQEYYSRVSVIQ